MDIDAQLDDLRREVRHLKDREEMVCELTGLRCIRVVWADLYVPARTAARVRAMFRPSTVIA